MCHTNNLLGVDESECFGFTLRIEANTGQMAHSPATFQVPIMCKPSHPEEIDPLGCVITEFRAAVLDIHVKYADDSCIPVRVGVLDVFV